MTALKQAALSYANRGWPVFPARADKTPYTKNGVLDATTNQNTIKNWWSEWPMANIALDTGGAGLIVLDLDPGHDVKELEKNVGVLPDTRLSSTTPRGGRHLFYSLNDGEIVAPSASKIAPHVDVRSFHSYVLLAPSKTADGSYAWDGDDNARPAYRTDDMLRVCNAGRAKAADHDTWIIEADLPENVALAIKWLREDAKIAVENHGGDAMAYATAAHMKSFGISEPLAFDLMWEHWSPRCSPPWTSDQAEHLQLKVQNGYAYNTSPPGNITPAYTVMKNASLFKPVKADTGSGGEWSAGRFRFVDRLGMSDIKPPEWLVEDFIPEKSYVILFGAPGTFKTFIALDIALSIAVGFGMGKDAPWPGITSSGPVLFAAGEGRSSISNRVKAWEKTHFAGASVKNFVLADPVPMVSEELTPFIDGALAASPQGYKLVVLDTVGRSMQGLNENAQEHASAFTNLVETVQHRLGCAVLALHHTGLKDNHRARGSSVFGADADTIIRLDRKDKNYLVSLSMVKQKDSEEWGKPEYVQLNETHISPEVKSLVAVKPEPQAVPAKADKSFEEEKSVVLDIVEEAVIARLQNNPSRSWSNTELGDAVACDDRVTISGQQVSKTYLRVLREDSTRRASDFYDADAARTKRWRYQD